MAQYKKNLYSSSLYGRIKAFYGEYITESFDAQEPFTSHITARIYAFLPVTSYSASSEYFTAVEPAAWTLDNGRKITRQINKPLNFNITGDQIKVIVELQNEAQQTIEAKLFKEEKIGEEYQWIFKETKTFNTLSLWDYGHTGEIAFSSFGFADYKVEIRAKTATANAIVVGAEVRTSNFELEVSSSKDNLAWTNWEKVPLNKISVGNDLYESTGASAINYAAVRYIRGKLILLSSDDTSTPLIDRVELRSEDSALYETGGNYDVRLDMVEVAKNIGATFKSTKKIRWTERLPEKTSMDIRTSSSRDSLFWGPVSAPYRKNTKRLRLKRGVNSHLVTLGQFDEASKFSFKKNATETVNFTKVDSYIDWDTQAYYPKDAANTAIRYIFSKTPKDVEDAKNRLQVINDLSKEKTRKIAFSPQPYFLTVQLVRDPAKGTPVVDWIDVNQNLSYSEPHNATEKSVSMVDGEGKGIKQIQLINEHIFNLPKTTGHTAYNIQKIQSAEQSYLLEDKTARPSDVMLYLESEGASATRTNLTTSASEKVMAKVTQRKLESGAETGVKVHYSYGSGQARYLRPYERELSSDFTPFLEEDKKYKYFIQNGWPNTVHKTTNNQLLSELSEMYEVSTSEITSANPGILYGSDNKLMNGQMILIPDSKQNERVSLLFKNGTGYTLKSSHNALLDKKNGLPVTDLSSEKIRVEVSTEPESGYVEWTSEEKIYTGVINADDVRNEFYIPQFSSASHADYERDYVVREGDTWQSVADDHEVHLSVLKVLNETAEFAVGKTIRIPANVILPELAPEVEFWDNEVFKINIVPDSVHKKNGVRVDESFIPVKQTASGEKALTFSYTESLPFTIDMVRGKDKNGMDPIPVYGAARIISVKKKVGSTTYQPWNETLGAGSFVLNSNYIDWWPAKDGDLEPLAGEVYTVTLTRNEVQSVIVRLDTDYFEEMGTDIVWRSPEVKVFDGICTPNNDFVMQLPALSEFEGYDQTIDNVDYVIEDNDLWVDTRVESAEGKNWLVGSLSGKDPSKNWHPTINTGFYYLKEKEYYLYSEAKKTVLTEKEMPAAENIEYVNGSTGIGALLLPASENLVKDSVLESTQFKKAAAFGIGSL